VPGNWRKSCCIVRQATRKIPKNEPSGDLTEKSMEKGWCNLQTEKSVEITPALAVLIKNVFSECT